jgi:peptidoglycan DL-endopeptidase CwlO
VARTGSPARVAWLVIAAASIGCATGIPTGARGSALETSYQPFSRPAPTQSPPPGPIIQVAAIRTEPGTPALSGVPAGDARTAPVAGGRSLPPDARERVVSVARRLVGKRQIRVDGRRYRSDCSGLVVGALRHIGLDVLTAGRRGENAVKTIFRYAQRRGRVYEGGRPLPGDLVFFRDTYDLNRDGRANDGLTHIGIVENVEQDGTVIVIHRVKRGVVRYRMNLEKPDVRMDPQTGRVMNDYIRYEGIRGRRERLTGQLFAGYATLLPPDSSSMYSSAPATTTGAR